MHRRIELFELLCVVQLACPVAACAQVQTNDPEPSGAIAAQHDGTSVKVQVATLGVSEAQDGPVLLELKDVELPDEAEALRVFVIPDDPVARGDTPVYLASVARGHLDRSSRTESFSVEVSAALKRLEQQGKYKFSGTHQVELLFQPVTSDAKIAPGNLKIGEVEIKREDPLQ